MSNGTSTVLKQHREARRSKALAQSYDDVIVGPGSHGRSTCRTKEHRA